MKKFTALWWIDKAASTTAALAIGLALGALLVNSWLVLALAIAFGGTATVMIADGVLHREEW
jgi:hypothetical protein